MADTLPLTLESLRDVIREECRLAVREEVYSFLLRAVSSPPSGEPEPATWSMSLGEVLDAVARLTDREAVRGVLAHERMNPDGPRSGVVVACEVRLAELAG